MATKKAIQIKGVPMSGLNQRQIGAMKKHSKHHTAKHIRGMANMMRNGMTFKQSHLAAMKKIGK
jgi:hypothetical protein